MDLIYLFESNLAFFVGFVFFLSLLVGSFLNVVIYRLPVMMERDWKSQCQEFLNVKSVEKQPAFTLSKPNSHCPHCDHQIRAWENIPLLSYLLLRGKCSSCRAKISIRYPAIELLTGILAAIVAWHFGFGWQAAAGVFLTWSLIALSMIDVDHQLLPDSITLPLLWVGLAMSLFPIFADMRTSLIGAMAGYLSLWIVFKLFKLVTGKEGMGYGDFKLLAALGAWMGWQSLPLIILLSSAVGALLGVMMIVFQGRDKAQPIPFGPYLAIAGWISLLWGEQITSAYLQFAGIPA